MTWLVAVSEYARQERASSALSDLDFTTYCPKYCEKIIRLERIVLRSRPLFGRYFFVSMCEQWKSIKNTRYVASVLMGPEELPLLVKDQVIDQIKEREVGGVVEWHASRFYQGQRVIPKSGPLEGIEGKFDRTTARDREVAFFDILGIETPSEFAPGVLVASNKHGEPVYKSRRQRRSNFKNAGQVTHHAEA